MTNIYGLLTIGQSALLTQQKAIDVTGNNIANVNTPGYSRQRLTMKQGGTVYINDQAMSTGVTADTGIQRLNDRFISVQLNAEYEDLGRWEAQKEALETVELLFDVSCYQIYSGLSELQNDTDVHVNNIIELLFVNY